MQKIKLALENLDVQSFVTANADTNRGTVMGHAPTQGGGPNCASAVDACPSGRGCTEINC